MRTSPLPTQIERLLSFVSPRTGVIRNLVRLPRGVDEPSPPILYQATLANFDFKKGQSSERSAAGKGMTEAEAMGGAIGEAIERYCASHVDPRQQRRVRLADMTGAHIAPAECVLYAESQYARDVFPYPQATSSVDIAWVAGRELPMQRPVAIPAALVYLYGSGAGGPDFFCPPTSSGLAAGPTLDAAIVSGLCELVERDAFLITWMNRLPAPEVDLARLGGPARGIRDHYARFGLETQVFDVTTDIPISVMMAVSTDTTGRSPAAVVGLGSHLDPATAVLKALFEICQVRPGETRRVEEMRAGGKTLPSYADVKTLEEHSAFFAPLDRLGEFDFLRCDAASRVAPLRPSLDRGTPEANLAVAVDVLSRAGCRVAYVDLTTDDVAQYPIRVVRTIATGLQPIHFGHGEERLGGRRMFDVPLAMGHATATRTEADLNPCPHPLA